MKLGFVALSLVSLIALANPGISDIPDGYRSGRSDAAPGAYKSIVSKSFEGFQKKVEVLEKKVLGMQMAAQLKGEIANKEMAEFIYLLEHECLRLMMDVQSVKPRDAAEMADQEFLMSAITNQYKNLRTYSERLFEDMIRFIDEKFPGPNGAQFRLLDPNSKTVLYAPNYRQDFAMTEKAQKDAYQKKLQEVTAEGFNPEQIVTLDKKTIQSFKGFQWFEYVQLANGKIRATQGNAGHIILAGGKEVRSAGQIAFLNDANGKTLFLVVSNASGSYKPDMSSAGRMLEDLMAKLDLRIHQVVLTKAEPFSLQILKIYEKGLGISKDETKARISKLKAQAKEILGMPADNSPNSCSLLYSMRLAAPAP